MSLQYPPGTIVTIPPIIRTPHWIDHQKVVNRGTTNNTQTHTERYNHRKPDTHNTTTSANVPWYHGTMMKWYIGTVLSSRLILISVGVSNLLLLETVVEESKKCLVFHNDWSFIVQWQRACCDGTKRETESILDLGLQRTGWGACMDRSYSLIHRGALSLSFYLLSLPLPAAT